MLKLARQQRFGKKCETLAGMQRSLFEEDVDADIAALTVHLDKLLPQSPEENEKAPRSRPVRKPLPAQLPRVDKIIQPDTDHCPECDEPLHFIRDEISEKLEYIPAHFVVNRYIRPQYSCPCCERVFSGEMPAHIHPKSAVEPSVIAQVVINKYGDHLPLYRQQQIFARSDIELPVSTMSDMIGVAGVALTPLADMLHRKILERSVIHSDETSLCILDTKKMENPANVRSGRMSAVKKVVHHWCTSTAGQGTATKIRKSGSGGGRAGWLLTEIRSTKRWLNGGKA